MLRKPHDYMKEQFSASVARELREKELMIINKTVLWFVKVTYFCIVVFISLCGWHLHLSSSVTLSIILKSSFFVVN